jgi:hypothetical protein
MSGLWRNRPETPEGKYLVQRRDGSIPRWPLFVIGGNDPAAPAALFAYALEAERLGMAADYVRDMRDMAEDWAAQQAEFGTTGNPDAPPDLTDDPDTVAKMRQGFSA